MDSNNEDFEEKVKKRIMKLQEIVKFYNLIFKVSYKNNYDELIYQESMCDIVFGKVKCGIKFLENILEEIYEEETDSYFYILSVFKIFFMKEIKFNLDSFEEKKIYFKILLGLFENKKLSEEENKNLDNLIFEMNESAFGKFAQKILKKDKNDILFPICFYLITKYSNSKAILVNMFIVFMIKKLKDENKYLHFDLEKKYSENEINEILLIDLISDIEKIYENKNNYIFCILKIFL